MSKDKDKFEKLMDNFDDNADVQSFNNDRYAGIDIAWSKKGFGFGHITFGVNKASGEVFADTECMSEKTVESLLVMAAPMLAKALVHIDVKQQEANRNKN